MKLIKNILGLGLLFVFGFVLISCVSPSEEIIEEFTVTWKDDNGDILETDTNVLSGTLPTYNSEIPTKESNEDHYDYVFKGWTPEITKVTKDITYTAVYDKVFDTYTITWLDSDNKILNKAQVEHGTIPSFSLPEDTVEWEYTSWDKEVVAATSDTTYIAVRVIQVYKVTWKDADGTVLKEEDVTYNNLPAFDLPLDTKQWKYLSWDQEITLTTKDITYQAVRELQKYKITYLDSDDTVFKTETLEYGKVPNVSLPKDTVEWKYTNWDKEFIAVTDDTTYKAVRQLQEYQISFDSNGGSKVETITGLYGEMIQKPTNPIKEEHGFMAWFQDLELTNEIKWPVELKGDLKLYAAWRTTVPLTDYLKNLLSNYAVNPLSFIPESMKPGFNLADPNKISNDYLNFTNISNIDLTGYGEQWNLVLENINESQRFFKVLTTIEAVVGTSITLFNNYIDSNPEDSNNYNAKHGIYSISIKFENNVISYKLSFGGSDSTTTEISMYQNINSPEKEVRIQLSPANALKYIVSEDKYEFGIRYLGLRRAYIKMEKDSNGHLYGEIFEYLGLDDKFQKSSSLQFYSDDTYVSVVGNKAASMIGFTGYINELYDFNSGKMLGYEVRETLKGITYNTLWFDLTNFTGLNNIKVTKSNETGEETNSNNVYLNNSSTVFETTRFGGLGLKTLSRRYDIELRSRYVFVKENDEIIKKEIKVPMLFIQQEKLDDLVTDVKKQNTYLTNFTYNVPSKVEDKIIADYETLIDIFIEQKDSFSSDDILDFIGSALR